MPITVKRSLRYPPGTGVTPDVARDLGYLTADLEAELGIVAPRQILDVGMVGQTRAGRQLSASDFTDCGAQAPLALWNLSDLTDASGNGRSLSNKGSVPFGAGVEGAASTAAVFSGSTAQALYLADSGGADPFRIRTGSWGAWHRSAKSGTDQVILTKSRDTGNQRSYLINQSSSGKTAGAVISLDGTNFITLGGTTRIDDDRWHHIVATFDGTMLRLYVDGSLDSQRDAQGVLFQSSGPVNIGGYGADGSTAAATPHFGRVDEAFITGEVLSLEQIRHLYGVKLTHGLAAVPRRASLRITRQRRGAALVNGDFPSNPARAHNFAAGSLTDLNGGASLTASGGVTTVAGPDGQKDSAILLQAGNYLQATDAGLPSGLTTRSYGIWICTLPHATSYQNFLAWGTNAGGRAVAWVDPVTGKLAFGNNGDSVTGTMVVADGKWHSVIAVEDNSAADGLKRKLYLDGALAAASTVMATITLAGANAFRIGADLSGAQPLYGAVSRAWVHAGALTWDQVQKVHMKSAAALPQSPKDAADHVEGLWASSLVLIGDDLEPQHLVDLEVSR